MNPSEILVAIGIARSLHDLAMTQFAAQNAAGQIDPEMRSAIMLQADLTDQTVDAIVANAYARIDQRASVAASMEADHVTVSDSPPTSSEPVEVVDGSVVMPAEPAPGGDTDATPPPVQAQHRGGRRKDVPRGTSFWIDYNCTVESYNRKCHHEVH